MERWWRGTWFPKVKVSIFVYKIKTEKCVRWFVYSWVNISKLGMSEPIWAQSIKINQREFPNQSWIHVTGKIKTFVLNLSVLYYRCFIKEVKDVFRVYTGLCKPRRRLWELWSRCKPLTLVITDRVLPKVSLLFIILCKHCKHLKWKTINLL